MHRGDTEADFSVCGTSIVRGPERCERCIVVTPRLKSCIYLLLSWCKKRVKRSLLSTLSLFEWSFHRNTPTSWSTLRHTTPSLPQGCERDGRDHVLGVDLDMVDGQNNSSFFLVTWQRNKSYVKTQTPLNKIIFVSIQTMGSINQLEPPISSSPYKQMLPWYPVAHLVLYGQFRKINIFCQKFSLNYLLGPLLPI